jgi:pyrroloquinoline quinone biosynthesis protein B
MSERNNLKIIILGSAQDGGVPQVGCNCINCARAVKHKRARRLVSSIGIYNPATGRAYMIDCTTDFREQIVMFDDCKSRKSIVGLDGILLTHAHVGHYLGLVQLGKESCNASKMPVYGTSRMIKFLSSNSPFKELIKNQNIVAHKVSPGKVCLKEKNLEIIPFNVPHRHELSDTVGYLIKGVKKQLLYVPDMDVLSAKVVNYISEVDIAMIDGTFYNKSEISSRRRFEEIAHPTISESMRKLKPFLKNTQICFTHFNHTNPILDQDSKAFKTIKDMDFKIAREGKIIKI